MQYRTLLILIIVMFFFFWCSCEQALKVGKLPSKAVVGGDAERLFFVVIKVTGISGALGLGDKGGINLRNVSKKGNVRTKKAQGAK